VALLVAVAAAVAVTAAYAAPMHQQSRTRITMMIGGINKIIYATATLAKQLGYYDKAGVDVYPIDSPAGIEEADALVAGQIDAAMGYYNHTIDLQSKGKNVECVVQIGLTPGHAVVVPTNSSIRSAADFKGKTLGITGTGSSTDFELQYLADKAGVKASDFTRLPVGAGQTFIAALKYGQIDGGITSQPTIQTLVKSGQAKVIIDLQNLAETTKAFGGAWPSTCIYMRNDYVKTHPEGVQKLVNAIVWTLKWIKTHTSAQVAAKMPSTYAPGGDNDLYASAWNASRSYYSTTGVMPKTGPSIILKFFSQFNPDIAKAHVNLAQTYTNTFALKAGKLKAPTPK
jgi:NitT/TauT family transport system substrate-binding protein